MGIVGARPAPFSVRGLSQGSGVLVTHQTTTHHPPVTIASTPDDPAVAHALMPLAGTAKTQGTSYVPLCDADYAASPLSSFSPAARVFVALGSLLDRLWTEWRSLIEDERSLSFRALVIAATARLTGL